MGLSSFKKRLIAHRGASTLLPENTLESFRRSLSDGATAIEADIRCTRDGIPVVFHDANGWRVAKQKAALREVTLKTLKNWDVSQGFLVRPVERHFVSHPFRVPTLEEMLEAFPSTEIYLDIKVHQQNDLQRILDVLRASKSAERVRLVSKNMWTLRRFRELGYQGAISFSVLDHLMMKFLPAKWIISMLSRADTAIVPLRVGNFLFTGERLIAKYHRLGFRVDVYPIEDVQGAEQVLKWGADGILTSDPALLLPIFSRYSE